MGQAVAGGAGVFGIGWDDSASGVGTRGWWAEGEGRRAGLLHEGVAMGSDAAACAEVAMVADRRWVASHGGGGAGRGAAGDADC